MVQELKFKGRIASQGFANGPTFPSEPMAETTNDSDRGGSGSLAEALTSAASDLNTLQGSLEDPEAKEIVEFQIAMLEDESVAQPVLERIATGEEPIDAWRSVMGDMIEDYQSADDGYFRARTFDLIDIRDRVVRKLSGVSERDIPPGSVFVADNLPPTRFLETDWTGSGIALREGSSSSHVAILARARGVPMLVGVEIEDGAASSLSGKALLDADQGVLVISPSLGTERAFEQRRSAARKLAEESAAYLDKPAMTAKGERVMVYLNIAGPDDLTGLDPNHCDGIGLVRTEFLFMDGNGPPSEEKQIAAYRRIVEWAAGRPVTFRTLDAGGDKPIPGITVDGEANPFLGMRGIRLSLRNPDLLKTQFRALLRTAAFGPVKIMFPMVTVTGELAAARAILEDARSDLLRRQETIGVVQLGIMVEVPAAAIAIEDFECDFFSIGSNDLVQYVMACGRDNAALDDLARADAKAVRVLIERVARHGAEIGREASLCGDMAGDPRYIDLLLDCGLRSLSVSPAALPLTKATIAKNGGELDG